MSREAGFTLLELLVAMVIMALLMTVLVAGSRLTGNMQAAVERRASALGDLALGLDQLRWRLSDALPAAPEAGRRPAPLFVGDGDGFRFAALRPGFERGWPLVAFEVRVRPRPLGSTLVLKAAPLDPKAPDLGVLDAVQARPLLRVGTGLALAYLARPGAPTQPPTWRSEWDGRFGQPLAVRLAAPDAPAAFPTTLLPLGAARSPLCASQGLEGAAACGS